VLSAEPTPTYQEVAVLIYSSTAPLDGRNSYPDAASRISIRGSEARGATCSDEKISSKSPTFYQFSIRTLFVVTDLLLLRPRGMQKKNDMGFKEKDRQETILDSDDS
jgi:hypothetical protein